MGATVSIINEEMCRPLDGGDIQNDDSTVEVNDVRRLRELLHVVYKDEDDLDDSALTPELALEIDTLMTKCKNEPGLGRLANDELLRDLLRQQMSELGDTPALEIEKNQTKDENGPKISPLSKEGIENKKKKDIASLARLHAQNRKFAKLEAGSITPSEEHGSISVVNHEHNDMDVTPTASNSSNPNNGQNFPSNQVEYKTMLSNGSSCSQRLNTITDDDPLEHSISSSIASSRKGSVHTSQEHDTKTKEESSEVNTTPRRQDSLKELPQAVNHGTSVNSDAAQPGSLSLDVQVSTPQAKSTGMVGRRRPSQLPLDMKDDNTSVPVANESSVTPKASNVPPRRRPTPMALKLDPEMDLTSNQPILNLQDSPGSSTANQGLELKCTFETGPNTNIGGNNGNSNGSNGTNGGIPKGASGYPIQGDSDVCHLSKSGTLVVDDFHIGIEGILDSPTGRFGKQGFDENGDENGKDNDKEEVKSDNGSETGVSFDVGGGGVGGNNVVRRPSKAKRRPSLNKSTNGATGEPFLELQRLGAGASGTVVKAIHVGTLRLVAIKTLPIFDAAKRHQMIRELKLLYKFQMETIKGSSTSSSTSMASLSENGINALNENGDGDGSEDPNATKEEDEEEHHSVVHCHEIVSFHDAFISPATGSVSLVVEYMNGGSLQDLADQGGCPDEAFLASVANHTLRGLKFLHTSKPRMLHRDIKPANILINTRGECKIADFGIYREMDAAGSANAHTFIGSLSFMSPERIRGDEYGCPADVWSIGLTLMTVALGRCPVTDNGRGYWALLHELTDKPPPTLPDDKPFSPLIRDFLSKHLTADPLLRWSAVQLLAHPFMHEHGYGEDSPIYTPNLSHLENDTSQPQESTPPNESLVVTELQINELNQVIEVLEKRTHEIITANVYNMANPEPLPLLAEDKLARFSEQIDMPVAMVRNAFEKRFNGEELPRILL